MKIPPLAIACDICGCTKIIPEHHICSMFVVTDDDVLHLSAERIIEILTSYFSGKFIHLSMSEIMLYRPDVVEEALRKEYPNLDCVTYSSALLCDVCFDKYLKEYPLI